MVALISDALAPRRLSKIGPALVGEERCARGLSKPSSSNAEWARQRAERVAAHQRRIATELRRHSRGKQPGEVTNGRRQAVWCVELQREFGSLTHAARFVGRAPSNILQAIRYGVRCGEYHWERFSAQRHAQAGRGDRVVMLPGATTPSAAPETHERDPLTFMMTRRHWQRVIATLRAENEEFPVPGSPSSPSLCSRPHDTA